MTDTHLPPLKRVLVVDDNEPSAQTLAWAMEMYGCDVRACHDGQSALAEAETFRPDIVLLDLGMPVMDGFEVCRRLRGHPDLKSVTVVAQSGWGSPDVRAKTTAAGFDHHLVKPLNLDQLADLIGLIH